MKMLNEINSRSLRTGLKFFSILALTESLVLTLEGYLRYKTIFCNKVAIDAQSIFNLFEEKIMLCSRDI